MERGGQRASEGSAFLIGIATMAALLGVVVAAQYRDPNLKTVKIGPRDHVLYSGIMATKTDATALGNALKNSGYLQDRGASVLLTKGFGGTTISFVVQDGVWEQAEMLSQFEELAREVAPTVGGFPVHVRLLDTQMNVKETSAVGEVKFEGPDGIYYEGSATKAEAQALGRRLESIGFFKGRGANVILTRHEDSTSLAFVLAVDGAWNNPKMVNSFEAIVRDVAPTIGGLPIEMHLVNTQVQIKKNEVIQ